MLRCRTSSSPPATRTPIEDFGLISSPTRPTRPSRARRASAPAELPPLEGPEAAAPEPDAEALTALIAARLDEDKAEDVLVIDLNGKSSLADSLVIASGRSQRHVSALADRLLRALKDAGFGRARVEGLPQADWVLIDAGDVIVHLFRPEVRAFYQLEKIWSVDAPRATVQA